jgi:hypothetical protein
MKLLGGGVAEHLLWIAQVGIDDRGVVVPGQDGLAVRDDDRVDIGIDHPGSGIGLLGDLVHVPLGRDARTDVEELADAGGGQEPHGPAEERAVGAGDRPDVGIDRGERPAQVLVGQEVVAAAQPVVVDPGDVRPFGVDARRHPARLVSHHGCGPGQQEARTCRCAP